MARTFTLVGTHAEDLASGRVVGPGEQVAEGDLDLNGAHDKRLLDEGLLLEQTSEKPQAQQQAPAPTPAAPAAAKPQEA